MWLNLNPFYFNEGMRWSHNSVEFHIHHNKLSHAVEVMHPTAFAKKEYQTSVFPYFDDKRDFALQLLNPMTCGIYRDPGISLFSPRGGHIDISVMAFHQIRKSYLSTVARQAVKVLADLCDVLL